MIFFESVFGPPGEEAVKSLEARIGSAIPESYRRFLLVSDGGRPEENILILGGREVNIAAFLSVQAEQSAFAMSGHQVADHPEAEGFLTIAYDDGGAMPATTSRPDSRS